MASQVEHGSEDCGIRGVRGGVARLRCARVPAQTQRAERHGIFLVATHYQGRGLNFLPLGGIPFTGLRPTKKIEQQRTERTMLRSLKQLYGDKIGATDGEIGRVKDFYLTTRTGRSVTWLRIPAPGCPAARCFSRPIRWRVWRCLEKSSARPSPGSKSKAALRSNCISRCRGNTRRSSTAITAGPTTGRATPSGV